MAAMEAPGTVHLRESGGLTWQPVSPRLRTVRLAVLAVLLGPFLLAFAALAIWVSPWCWVGAAVVAAVLAWGGYVIVRQVPAISWVELPDEIVIRRGRIFRRMVVVPYGRLQYVDLQSGPLMRHFGLATIEIHTASPSSSGEVPGLPTEVAESLRERLSERGESLRAGL
jgi:membrane protein YdbS with pleckstrin-like domain